MAKPLDRFAGKWPLQPHPALRATFPSRGRLYSCFPILCDKERKKRLPLEGKLSPKVTDEV